MRRSAHRARGTCARAAADSSLTYPCAVTPLRIIAGKKKPRTFGGASDPLHRFERPGGSLSARAERAFRIQSAQRTGTSRHHEHLNFSAETFGADAPASIARPACSCTRHVVPDNRNKLAAAVTRARVDPQVSVGMSLQASSSFCASLPRSPTRQKLETIVRT